MKEFQVDIETPDGLMNTVVMHPEDGGPFPTAVCFMDSCGIRPDFLQMARRVAVVGYSVLTPNMYYRRARDVTLDPDRIDADESYNDGRALMWELNRSITTANVERDMEALLNWVSGYSGALGGRVGVYGYCLGGNLAMTTAACFAERIGAAASFHGGGFVQGDTSKAKNICADVYFAHAGSDKYIPLERIRSIEDQLTTTGVRHRFEVYDDAHHGFTIPGRRAFHQPSADRAWERLFALFRRNLPQAAMSDRPSRDCMGIAHV